MNYREEVLKNVAGHVDTKEDQLALAALGLAGETGEVVDLLKKHLFHAKPLDRENLIKELGDVRWYFELLCHLADTTIEEVERKNVEKLHARHPKGWTPESAAAKIDEEEEIERSQAW